MKIRKIRRDAPRCARTYRCACPRGVTITTPVTFPKKLNKPVVPETPVCGACGEPMMRVGNVYQALLSSTWDTEAMRARVRAMYGAMVGRNNGAYRTGLSGGC